MSETVTVYFGGEAHERWTGEGLEVSYTGRVPVLARRDHAGEWLALPYPPEQGSDVKADYNASARSIELASSLCLFTAPPLTMAYFEAAAAVAEAMLGCGDPRELPEYFHAELTGKADSLILPELLRVLLDEYRLSWEDACEIVAGCFSLWADSGTFSAPLSSISALQPRDAALISAVNVKLCAELKGFFPGDWDRISSGAAIADEEVRFTRLAAELCGSASCSEDLLAGELRTLYTARPEKFEVL